MANLWLFPIVLRVACLMLALLLSAGVAQAGVLTTIDFGSDHADAALPGPGDHCQTPPGRACFSDVTQTFAGHGAIEHVSLTATLSNPFTLGELSLSLSHDGVTVVLFESSSHSTQLLGGVTITFDDFAAAPLPNFSGLVSGTFRPDSPLRAFNGLGASGDWTLTIGDHDVGDTSRYSGAVLAVTTPEPATLMLLVLGFGLLLAARINAPDFGRLANSPRHHGPARAEGEVSGKTRSVRRWPCSSSHAGEVIACMVHAQHSPEPHPVLI
jgi:hypothetical protein